MEERLAKWKLPDLHRLMDLVDLPRGSGDKVKSHPSLTSCCFMPVCLPTACCLLRCISSVTKLHFS